MVRVEVVGFKKVSQGQSGEGLAFFGWGMGDRVAGLPEGAFSGSIDFQMRLPWGVNGVRLPFSHAAAVNIPPVPGFRLMNRPRKANADPSTHHPPPPPQRRRPVAGDPGNEVRLGPLSLRMTVHLFCTSLKRVGLLPMNKGCEARVWRPARQPVWRPALLSEVLFSPDVTCDASHDAPHEQGRKASADSSTAVGMTVWW